MGCMFRVGEWLVEPDLNTVTGTNGKISVEPKVIEVLKFLAGHPGEVLSKKQILEAVWPGIFVSEEVVRYSISAIRKALQDDPKHPRIVETIARRGYRLIADVGNEPVAESGGSIAVLAFSDMSPCRDQEYFCDGIAEQIINDLIRIGGLRVSSRTSSFAFKGKSEDVRAIGRKLGVATVLEGSVRKSGNRLRITAQWVDAEDGCHLWSERYDREMKDIFALQDEIAGIIADRLNNRGRISKFQIPKSP